MKRNIIQLDNGNIEHRTEKQKKRKRLSSFQRRILSESLGLGVSLAMPLVGGTLIGLFIDSIIGTRPKVTLGLLFFGLVISILHMVHLARIKK